MKSKLQFFNFSPRMLKVLVPNFAGMFRVKAGRPLVAWFLRATRWVRGNLTSSYVRICVSFIRTLLPLAKRSGVKYVVLYLKVCNMLLMQYVAGQVPVNPRTLGLAVSQTQSGLPRIIPRVHRQFIIEGSTFHVRFWLTLFSIYRAIDYRGKLKINSIINPGVLLSNSTFSEFQSACLSFIKLNKIQSFDKMPEAVPFTVSTRSPNSFHIDPVLADRPKEISKEAHLTEDVALTASSLPSIIASWISLGRNGLGKYAKLYASITGSRAFALWIAAYELSRHWTTHNKVIGWFFSPAAFSKYAGKLAYKIEPAGKVRVFAMVDVVSQWLLAPLHNILFSVLRKLPTDGTFDQLGRVKSFAQYLVRAEIKQVYSFDLTAATDRLPLSLQQVLLNCFFSDDRVPILWANLLVDRWYKLPRLNGDYRATICSKLGLEPSSTDQYLVDFLEINKAHFKAPCVTAVKYTVGQPIGARSSWAMLALTHHVIVHNAALRVNLPYFSDYLILGDDIVIANQAVAMAYVDLLSEYGIPINMTKSIQSNNSSFEFAKRFLMSGVDVSPITFRDMACARFDVRALQALIQKVLAFRDLKVSQVLSIAGYGYHAIARIYAPYVAVSRRLGRLLILLSFPGEPFSHLSGVNEWALSHGFNVKSIRKPRGNVVGYVRSQILNLCRSVKFPHVPADKQLFFEAISRYAQTNWPMANLFWDVIRPYYVELKDLSMSTYTSIAYNKAYQKEMNSDDLNLLYSKLRDAEKGATNASNELQMYSEYNSIITLNSARNLRFADDLRAHFPTLTSDLGKVTTSLGKAKSSLPLPKSK